MADEKKPPYKYEPKPTTGGPAKPPSDKPPYKYPGPTTGKPKD